MPSEHPADARRFEQLTGRSPAMLELFEILERIVSNPVASTILVCGESGTGKQLVAHAIHSASQRARHPFVEFNCAAIPENLLEGELFGHVSGAYTDARNDRPGLFQQANGGTIFLDEIGEMPLATQAKLLKVIEDKKIRKLGSSRDITVDVRIVAATNKVLAREAAAGRFREDLFWRLNVIPLYIAPLRERPEDIELLAGQFIAELNRRMNRNISGFSAEAMKALRAHNWPGNVRELKNVVERCALLEGDDIISCRFLKLQDSFATGPAVPVLTDDELDDPSFSLDDYLASIEKEIIRKSLDKSGGNQSEAARKLKLSREIFRYRMKKYGMDKEK